MRSSIRRLLFFALLMASLGALGAAPAQQAPIWAAISPNNEVTSSVTWGPTEEIARQAALEACKRISKTCAAPASTDDLNDTFAAMCCTSPKLGCAIGVGRNRDVALQMVRKIFSDAGYSQCSLSHYISARTGQKLP